MNYLFRQALVKAEEVRMELGLTMFQPINIFDSCIKLGLDVRFVDINMEGMYTIQKNETQPTILLSSLRPLPRRCFTCAHELGHHIFKHGMKADGLSNSDEPAESNDPEEFLVDSFAGALLMPVLGIQAEFAKRNWLLANASPIQFYTICSTFGTGYSTLITHCKVNKLISDEKVASLNKITPIKLFGSLFKNGTNNSYFKIIDKHSQLSVIDLEVSNYILLPEDIMIEGDHLENCGETAQGIGYLALKPGIVRAASLNGKFSSFIRIQNHAYTGLVENRHLETIKD